MMEAPSCIYSLPQALAYPYTRAPATVRALRSKNQYDSIWIDNRFVMMLSHGNEACHHAVNERVLHNLGRELGVSFRFKHAAFDNIHQLQTPLAFMQELSENKYYVNLIACGAGQGLCDAASLGLICFGTPRLSYHRAICHPNCLCNDLTDFKRKFDQVAGSVNLQEEIRAWQDLMLADRMVRQPLHLLETAVEMKRSSAIRSGHPRHALPSCTITPLSADEEMSEIGKINYVKVQNIARSEYEKNNFAAIADHCKQALFFNESDVETYFLLACAYYGAGDSITALEWLDKSKNIDKAYKPVDQLICLIGAEFIHTNYADHLEAHNQSFNRLKKYIDSTVIGQIDDFDLQHAGYYDEIVDDLVTKIPKGENYETHRIILYHLRKQLKSVVAAERAQGATNLRLGT
jgi:tetratricopeptide (TPR) repeat protein